MSEKVVFFPWLLCCLLLHLLIGNSRAVANHRQKLRRNPCPSIRHQVKKPSGQKWCLQETGVINWGNQTMQSCSHFLSMDCRESANSMLTVSILATSRDKNIDLPQALWQTHMLHVWYIFRMFIYIWLKLTVNIGKYAVPPMANSSCESLPGLKSSFGNPEGFEHPILGGWAPRTCKSWGKPGGGFKVFYFYPY